MLSSRVFSVRDTDSACPEANKSRLLQTQAPIDIGLVPISMISPESDSREARCPNALMNDRRRLGLEVLCYLWLHVYVKARQASFVEPGVGVERTSAIR